ncbi:MAG: hypothetical protein ACM3ZT_03590 [Bacillota bacterium]
MAEEPETERAAAGSAPTTARRVINVLAALVGFGVMALAVALLFAEWPLGSVLAVFVSGLALLPFIPIPGRGARTVVFVLALAFAILMPVWQSRTVHRETQSAFLFASEAAARLAETSVKDGGWPATAEGFPDKLEPVYGDGYSRDLAIKDCGGASCTLIVTLADERYDAEIRGRSFALSTTDGGKTWHCGPSGEHSVIPSDLPAACRVLNAR